MTKGSGQQRELFGNLANTPPPPPRQLAAWEPATWPVARGWRGVVNEFLSGVAGARIAAFVQDRLAAGATVFPARPLRALELTPLAEVKVVILGQDPYHGPGQAEGLAFSVPPGVKVPPSLRNIFKELQRDLGLSPPADGSLVRWARQGVLLLNASLTVEEGSAGAHSGIGWEALTDAVVHEVAALPRPVVFLLWGAHAQAKRALVEAAAPDGRHAVLMANHPSPLSALRPPQPFIGCGHFRAANAFLAAHGEEAIAW